MAKEQVELDHSKEINIQIKNMLDSVLALANLDFDPKVELMGESDQLDSLATGINMLGEELKTKVVKLKERDALIKEVHHRVKNNLQIVSSILNLQASVTQNELIIEKIGDCQQRIRAIALVHEQLYNSNNLSYLEINEYFGSLCHRMEESFSKNDISLIFKGLSSSVIINSDSMIPIGLLASEIIMNSFKHGFPNEATGSIIVELTKQKDEITIHFSDNGIGYKNEKDFHESKSLGLQLVHTLTDQIDGKIQFNKGKGTSISLKFTLATNQ